MYGTVEPAFLLGNVENHGDVIGEKHACLSQLLVGVGFRGYSWNKTSQSSPPPNPDETW